MINLLNLLMCFAPKVPGPPPVPAVPDAPSPTAEPLSQPADTVSDRGAGRRRTGKGSLRLARGSGLNV